MTEIGIDNLGAEFKRTSNDFHLKWLEQDNCICNICHGTGAKIEISYITRDYVSNRTKKICKTLQAHEHSLWICFKCLTNFERAKIEAQEKAKKRKERE